MSDTHHPMLAATSGRVRSLILGFVMGTACVFTPLDRALAQLASGAPPVDPPIERPLASGNLSIGQWLLTPTLDLSTLYNSNIQSSTSPATKLASPGFSYRPAMLLENDTGIYDTKAYANLNSTIYSDHNNGVAYKLGYTTGVNSCGAVFFGFLFWRVTRWRRRGRA